MTPVTWNVAGRRSLLGILGTSLARAGRSTRRAAGRAGLLTLAVARVVFRFLLIVAGLGFLDFGAWSWHRPVGYVAIGLSCLVLEWAMKRE